MSAASLRETQQLIAAMLMNPLNASQDMAETLPDGRNVKQIAEQLIAPNDRLSSCERLEIYNRQYWFRLIDCLHADFPGLRAVLGDTDFYKLCVAYLVRYPSSSYSLRDLGASMERFLMEEPRWAQGRKGVAIDMARFEWAQIVAFDGPALPALELAKLQSADPNALRLKLQPYLSILVLRYPLDDLVLALKKVESSRSEASREALEIKPATARIELPARKTTYVVVHRYQNSLYYKRLDRPAYEALTALRDGASIGEACQRALPMLLKSQVAMQDVGQVIQGWFQAWSLLQWFAIDSDGLKT